MLGKILLPCYILHRADTVKRDNACVRAQPVAFFALPYRGATIAAVSRTPLGDLLEKLRIAEECRGAVQTHWLSSLCHIV